MNMEVRRADSSALQLCHQHLPDHERVSPILRLSAGVKHSQLPETATLTRKSSNTVRLSSPWPSSRSLADPPATVISEVGVDRLLYSLDYPYEAFERTRLGLRRLRLVLILSSQSAARGSTESSRTQRSARRTSSASGARRRSSCLG